jgi:hypothetical protein
MSRAAFFKYWKELEKSEALVATRKIGRATMCKLDRANEIVVQLIKLDAAIPRNAMHKQMRPCQEQVVVRESSM